MSSPTDPLAPFRRKGQTPAVPVEKPAAEKIPYEAFHPSTEERRFLEFRCKFPEPGEAFSNMTLTGVQGEWRMGLGITLEYAKPMVVIIKGRNLTALFRAIQNWKVEWLAEFDPVEHLEPADSNAPFIESITMHSTRPEAPPPANQRH
jgi:hypothetical protein